MELGLNTEIRFRLQQEKSGMNFAILVIAVVCIVILESLSIDALTYSAGGARKRFEDKLNVCKTYPFYESYLKSISNPSGKYIIYVFHDQSLGSQGGLGDRLGGLITAFAFAMRTNRTLLIHGDKSFEDAFQPYSPNSDSRMTWSDWDWSGLSKSAYHESGQHVLNYARCVNPRPGQTQCALDYDTPHKIVKFRSNRAYICRWNLRKDLVSATHLLQTLGINDDSDLFQVGGCMLRLAMSPTEKLWAAIDESLEQDISRNGNIASKAMETSSQIGIHFRCGDSSFKADPNKPINPECIVNPSTVWKGTNFYDDHSMDSPIDAALCAKKLAVGAFNEATASKTLVFIASDYPPSSEQINKTLGWSFAITPPQGCHVDLQSSDKCTLQTSIHWIMLALSDHIVMQSMQVGEAHHQSPYSDPIKDPMELERPPISAFSRFAALYSLSLNVITFGSHCEPINQKKLSRQTQGNWVCSPKMFF